MKSNLPDWVKTQTKSTKINHGTSKMKKTMTKIIFMCAAFSLFLFLICGLSVTISSIQHVVIGTYTNSPTSTLTFIPTNTFTPTSTSTITDTPTITLTSTKTKVPTATLRPTRTPRPTSTRVPYVEPVQSSSQYPMGVTAVCRDGTYSYSLHRNGTCSRHGGVLIWVP